jgi:DNA-directed RNA polymerase subunit RPC12/RpoP
MSNPFDGFKCNHCNIAFSIEPKPNGDIYCPLCSSKVHDMILRVEDSIHIMEKLKTRIYDNSFPSKKKRRIETVDGDDYSFDRKKYVKLTRVIDRNRNRYYELVEDPETGETIRLIDEPLTKHTGRGSAKKT